MSEELKPCPFCGSRRISLDWDLYDTDEGRRHRSRIRCLDCRLEPKIFKTHAEARSYWNARAQPAEQQDEPVAMVVSKFGDPEAFGEREIEARADLSKVPYNTPLYRRPAAQAVKLPERLPGDDGVCTESHHASGWNECRAETAKLNGIET